MNALGDKSYKWEDLEAVNEKTLNTTERMGVPGGVVYRTTVETADGVAVAMVFVPEPES